MRRVWFLFLSALLMLWFSVPIAAAQPSENTFAPDRILVKFKKGLSDHERAAVHEKTQGKEKERIQLGENAWVVVEVPFGKVKEFKAKYAQERIVEAVEPDYLYTTTETANAIPNDGEINNQWHHETIHSFNAWDVTAGSSKIIAIIDTGIDLNHPDLKDRLIKGATFVKGTKSPMDDNGHGTHVAGIAAGTGNNSIGISGVDQTAKLMPVKVLNKNGSGWTSDIIKGVRYAVDNGAHVLSMSLGGPSYSQSFQDAIDYAWGLNKIIVAAAGNDGVTTKSYPGAYNHVVAVAATDQNNMKTSWSNYGADWVDIAAPGLNIYSTLKGGSYGTMSGTSMATPMVSGLMALTWGVHPGETNAVIVNRVLSTADKSTVKNTGTANGRIDAEMAVVGF